MNFCLRYRVGVPALIAATSARKCVQNALRQSRARDRARETPSPYMKMISGKRRPHVLLTISAAVSPPSPYVIRSGSSCKNESRAVRPSGIRSNRSQEYRVNRRDVPSRSTIRARCGSCRSPDARRGAVGPAGRAHMQNARARSAARSASMPTIVPPSPSAARRAAVPLPAERRVNNRVARLYGERLQHFIHKHAVVMRFHINNWRYRASPQMRRHCARCRPCISSTHPPPRPRPCPRHRDNCLVRNRSNDFRCSGISTRPEPSTSARDEPARKRRARPRERHPVHPLCIGARLLSHALRE